MASYLLKLISISYFFQFLFPEEFLKQKVIHNYFEKQKKTTEKKQTEKMVFSGFLSFCLSNLKNTMKSSCYNFNYWDSLGNSMLIFLILLHLSALALKCTVETTNKCLCACKDPLEGETGDSTCVFGTDTDCADGHTLTVAATKETLDLTTFVLNKTVETTPEGETEAVTSYETLTEIKQLTITKSGTLTSITVTNGDETTKKYLFKNAEFTGYDLVDLALGYTSNINLGNAIGNLRDDFSYTVTTTRTGFFLVSKFPLTNTNYFNRLFSSNPKLYRYGTTEDSHITCTFDGTKFEEYMCENFAHDEMILLFNGTSFTSTTLTQGAWRDVVFTNENISVEDTTYIITAQKLKTNGVFNIKGSITTVANFTMKSGIANRVDSKTFAPIIITLLDTPAPQTTDPVFFYLSQKERSTTSWSGISLFSFKVNSNYYRVTNLANNKYCTIKADGTAFVEPDCVVGILDDTNALTLKYLGTQTTIPIVNTAQKTFSTFGFNAITDVKTIDGYNFATLTLNVRKVDLINVKIPTLVFTPTFVYGTCLTSIVGSITIPTDSTNINGYILHDGSITGSQTTRIGTKNGKTYYRAMKTGHPYQNFCQLNCDAEGTCTFVQSDCETYATGEFAIFVLGNGVTKMDNIPGDVAREYTTCNLKAAGKLEVGTSVQLTCSNVDMGANPLIISTGIITINSYTTTSTAISVLSNLPTTLSIGSLKYIWVQSDAATSITDRCVQATNNYYRCAKEITDFEMLNYCTYTGTNYDLVDCDQADANTQKSERGHSFWKRLLTYNNYFNVKE
ncbi:hypothetical protein EIN_400970, partial [Entamoeba invadens IP1]